MKMLIVTFTLASILATSAVAVAGPAARNAKNVESYSNESPDAPYVAPAAPSRSTPVRPFTWGEKRMFDWATKDNNRN